MNYNKTATCQLQRKKIKRRIIKKPEQSNITNSLAHTKWNCKYHIVFAPKYRRKVFFEEKRIEIREILRTLCQWKGIEVIEGEICPDHIHMLVSIPPAMRVDYYDLNLLFPAHAVAGSYLVCGVGFFDFDKRCAVGQSARFYRDLVFGFEFYSALIHFAALLRFGRCNKFSVVKYFDFSYVRENGDFSLFACTVFITLARKM